MTINSGGLDPFADVDVGIQQERLRGMQEFISRDLFLHQVVPDIFMKKTPGTDREVSLEDLNIIDFRFVPQLTLKRGSNFLSVLAIDPSIPAAEAIPMASEVKLGYVTGPRWRYISENTGVDDRKAKRVIDAAQTFCLARREGFIPNLSFSLLDISEPEPPS